jgi:acyl carrier protein
MATETDIRRVLREVLDVPDLVVTRTTRLEEVPNYDSLTHVQLMLSLESCFGAVFTPEESSSARTVADLIGIVEKHLAEQQ